ncbi:MAG: NDP-hexose 2,3-dehydratase family protein [Lachnospiraceae bacterium]|nr:NDP-hexose 2,3-dehydratase family protein [Lachnospiraceae bacterium]
MSITYDILKSWSNVEGNVNSIPDILSWISKKDEKFNVNIKKIDFLYNGFWYYDNEDGHIKNKNNSFFQLSGYQEIEDDKIIKEQPIILQYEIGYLGIICKMIDGELNCLMQAKIEPGNINKIQISPTIQATKSNFTAKHGGKTPKYLDYFIKSKDYKIIVDQIQSEQSSRFYKKRNRNIIILVDEDVKVYSDSYMWMTLGQIKELMRIDNLVNMDTRTVLSCIPLKLSDLDDGESEKIKSLFTDKGLYDSMFKQPDTQTIKSVFNFLNDEKMYNSDCSRLVPLKSLKSWKLDKQEIVCKQPYDFKVVYCNIEIEGREVNYWEQPLVEACGNAILGLFTREENGVRKFLVKAKKEMGCFDTVELGPTIQLEPTNPKNQMDSIEKCFIERAKKQSGILIDVMLSEEGGRFYHEQNRNIIIDIKDEVIKDLPEGYFWMDYASLNYLVQFNNYLNIQLRNLLSLLKI